ncbi:MULTISPECIES: hypothetical protein [Cryobacterium]|uniref:hypothetical protein n=1 Tax=Cryobacterium TaxID=69578 RepID=UPI0008B6A75A|nr:MULTISPECIES: hypothetical protein [Cryobacterium]SEN21082.1 hypothetical protein SAMN05216281_1059 [Cryobacterium luteum]
MTVTLRRILTSEFPSWLDRSCIEYAGLVTQGGSHEEAQRIAASSMARSFPGGAPSEVAQYETSFRVFYLRGPAGIIVALAEQIG